MKLFKAIVFLFVFCQSFSQNKQSNFSNFTQFEITVPFGLNEHKELDEIRPKPWYRPSGFGTKLGYGYIFHNWIGVSSHSGLDLNWDTKLISVPIYAQLSISPKIANETRLITQFGFGQSFVLGRGNIAGNFYKARIGFLNNDDFSLFIDSSFYGFKFNQQSLNTISLGLSVFSFD